MGKLQISTTVAFQLAVAADVLFLMTLKDKLENINSERGSPQAELEHSVGGVLQNLVYCETEDMALVGMQLECYDMRMGHHEKKLPKRLHATPILTRIRDTLDKFSPVMA